MRNKETDMLVIHYRYRFLCLLLSIALLSAFSGCFAQTGEDDSTISPEAVTTTDGAISTTSSISDIDKDAYFNTFQHFHNSFVKIVQQDDNYIIKESDEHAGNFYEIYDHDGNLLDIGYHDYRGSFAISKEDNIVILEYGFGGTNVFPSYRLYDVENGVVSRYFPGPIATHDRFIAYLEFEEQEAVLVVRDIFDTGRFYREFTGSFDQSIYMWFDDLSFSEDGAKIILRYSDLNDPSDAREEIFEIN